MCLMKPMSHISIKSDADLDDTLVPTTKVDALACTRVAELLAVRAPGLDSARLLADWRVLFKKSPWDPDGKVRTAVAGEMH